MSTALLKEMEGVLQQMLEPHLPDCKYEEMIAHLGERAGFAALMKSASASWGQRHPGNERLLGPNRAAVTSLLSKVQSALK